jgi:hypothetical protein
LFIKYRVALFSDEHCPEYAAHEPRRFDNDHFHIGKPIPFMYLRIHAYYGHYLRRRVTRSPSSSSISPMANHTQTAGSASADSIKIPAAVSI